MKKIIYYFFTLISICSLVACLFLRGNYYEFNSSNVKNNIEYLSSDKFAGRLAGTENNEMLAEELKETFKEYNLSLIHI
jgi:5-methylthioribose kinase